MIVFCSSQKYQQYDDRHERINEIDLDMPMLHPSDPSRDPEACVKDWLVQPAPESVPYLEMVRQPFRKGRMGRRRELPYVLLDVEEIAEDPPEGHGKRGCRVLHPVGDLFESAVPKRHAADGAGTRMEQQIGRHDYRQDAQESDRRRIGGP